MTRSTLVKAAALSAFAAVAATSAQAYEITSPGDPALAGFSVIGFDTVPFGAYSSLTIAGTTFSADAGKSLYIDADYAGNYNTTGASLGNTYNADAFGTLTVSFAAPTTAFGFNWGAADTVWTLTAFDSSSNVLESYSLPATGASNAGEFFGIAHAGIAYATITGDSSDYVFVDNFNVAAVPEPESYGLMALGLAGLGLLMRRQQKASRRA